MLFAMDRHPALEEAFEQFRQVIIEKLVDGDAEIKSLHAALLESGFSKERMDEIRKKSHAQSGDYRNYLEDSLPQLHKFL